MPKHILLQILLQDVMLILYIENLGPRIICLRARYANVKVCLCRGFTLWWEQVRNSDLKYALLSIRVSIKIITRETTRAWNPRSEETGVRLDGIALPKHGFERTQAEYLSFQFDVTREDPAHRRSCPFPCIIINALWKLFWTPASQLSVLRFPDFVQQYKYLLIPIQPRVQFDSN